LLKLLTRIAEGTTTCPLPREHLVAATAHACAETEGVVVDGLTIGKLEHLTCERVLWNVRSVLDHELVGVSAHHAIAAVALENGAAPCSITASTAVLAMATNAAENEWSLALLADTIQIRHRHLLLL
jgi:hypothetical protein